MKKFHRAFNVFSCFQTHEKEIHPDSYSIKIKEQTRKLAAACTWVRQGYVDAVWRDFRRVSILSHFKTHEKESYWTWKKKDPTRSEKEVRPDSNSLSHFKSREKKTHPGLNSLSCFKAHEKEVHWTQTRSLISRLVKKRPTRVWKRGPPGPLF